MPDPIDLLKIQPGDRVGHVDCDYLLFEVVKVHTEAEDEDEPSPNGVRGVDVKSLRTGGTFEFADGVRDSALNKIGPPPTEDSRMSAFEVRRRQVREHEELATRSFADFELVGGHATVYPGLRKWRFKHPDHFHHWFDLITWPGNLLVSGDIGECWWKQYEPILAWAAGSLHSIDYFAEKVIRHIPTTEPCGNVAEAWVWEEFATKAEEHLLGGGLTRLTRGGKDVDETIEHLEETRDALLNWADESGGEGFLHRLYHESDWIDGCDAPNLHRYTSTFLWGRSAVKVATKLLGYTNHKE